MTRVTGTINIENAKIMWRNFSGVGDAYNREGDRFFHVRIDDPELAEQLLSDGWNVKTIEPKEEGDQPTHHMKVAIKYGSIPPKIYMITSKNNILLDEDTVGQLDSADIANIDLVIRPYNWVTQEGTRNEKRGVKAYVKTMYVTIEEDVFASKYGI